MNWIEFITAHASSAHWILLVGALLAGMNIPISIDLLMIIGATLAATIIPEHLIQLYFFLLIGCAISAWIAYWLGRIIGRKLLSIPFFSKFISPRRMAKVKTFYKKRGALALLIGRFIPFGVRNCLYMTCGMSRMPFMKFVLCDGIAVTLWSSLSFFLYYFLGKNIESLYSHVKWTNFFIFVAFSVTVIGIIWYKKKKKVKEENV